MTSKNPLPGKSAPSIKLGPLAKKSFDDSYTANTFMIQIGAVQNAPMNPSHPLDKPKNFSDRVNTKHLALDEPGLENMDQINIMHTNLNGVVQSLVAENYMVRRDLAEIKVMLRSSLGSASKITEVSNLPATYASVSNSSGEAVVINPTKLDQGKKATIKQQESAFTNPQEGSGVEQCVNSADRYKLNSVATTKLGKDYIAAAPNKKRPRIRIYGFTEEYNADDLIKLLTEQNPNLISSSSTVKVEHIYFVKSKDRYGAKLEVDATTFKSFMAIEKVFIGWEVCWVNEELNIRRCFKCWGFNHVSSNCHKTEERCPNCGDTHKKQDCTSNVVKCAVCSDAVRISHLKIDPNHYALSSSCPSFLHRVDLERRMTDYGK